MPGIFANGSALAAPMSAPAQRYHEPTAQQPADAYTRQVYANQAREEADIQRAVERERLLQRGYALAGFVQRDRRQELTGPRFMWERTQAAAWPPQMPAGAVQAVEAAITADRAARSALSGAELAFALWQRDHVAATPERARVRYEELTEDLLPAAQRAAAQLDQQLTEAAAVVEQIERWQAVELAAPGRRAAAEKAYQQTLATIDTELSFARQTAKRLGAL